MNRLILAAGVAALALTAPVSAQPDKGGKGKGGQSAQVDRGGGGQDRAQRAERSGGGEARQQRQAMRQQMERRGGEARQQRLAARERVERRAQRSEQRGADRRFAVMQQREDRREARQAKRLEDRREARQILPGRIEDRREARVERRERIAERVPAFVEERRARGDRGELRRAIERSQQRARSLAGRGSDDGFARYLRDRDGDVLRLRRDFDEDGWFERRFAARGLPAAYFGCPPGLAKKTPACVPPGQARQAFVGQALPALYANALLPVGLRDIYYDTDDYYWRYGDGYAYRVDRERNLVNSILPLIGAGLGLGMPFPYSSPSYYVPNAYQSFYPDNPYTSFRYADGYVYEIDRGSGLIIDVVPLLDQGYGIGQMLPASYSYYNVPYQYRDWYEDDDDYYYRYAPGAIYQVDRESQLITAIVSLLTGTRGLAVGQPLPIGYDAYNVPYAFRDDYYDTPDAWYRYSDGYIYRVDPETRLITAMIDAIV